MIQVAVNGAETVLAGFDLSLDAVETSHQQGCKEQVRIRQWIGWAELDALRLGVVGQRDTHSGTAIAFREDQVDGSFKARYKTLVAVGSWCSKSQEGRCVRE